MPSRTKRKRYRRQLAKATVFAPATLGGWGQNAPLRRSDWLIVRQAIRERWPVPESVKREIISGVDRVLSDPTAEFRWQAAAVKLVLTMSEAG